MSAPSVELLEFLGEFADGESGWIDPLDLEEAESVGGDAAPEDAR